MKKNKQNKQNIEIVEKITNELFSLLQIKAKFEVKPDEENDAILLQINTQDEAGLLIGTRGETLNSIQTIIGMIFRKRTGEWKRILVNVADWREKQTDRLTQLATQTAERVKSSQQPQPLYNLTPSQRRVVHLVLASDKEVETESKGEGKERYLIIKPKMEE
ncbi:hypothetical protein A2Z22_02950 [Candidatus Woesebacteria bacterium RBG_16_34_12]|uniref:R3H domain-containing protein n=1 Tax=Candidatus Woesebacteria bacterium RBG_16_34_12 TaxID=1802480 RepID=A0A1F7X8W7_9BACT|nr:MAG: hypothetical protein A2Z22_02950 [Candidatus Woesebacteria bacterium RBG_16_34_12]